MKRLLLLPLVLAAVAHADSDPMSLLYTGSNLWLPSSFLSAGQVPDVLNRILGTSVPVGGLMCFMAFMMEATRLSLLEGFSLQRFFRLFALTCVIGVFVGTSAMWDFATRTVVLAPCEMMINSVKSVTTDQAVTQYGTALAAAAQSQYEGVGSLLTSVLRYGIANLMMAISLVIALCITWAISLYMCVMWTLLYIIGPILFPWILFAPFASIGWGWLKSFLAFSIMGVVGAVAMGLVLGTGLLNFAVDNTGTSSFIQSLASSIIVIVVMVMVPRVTHGIFGGISLSPLATAAFIGEAAAVVASGGTLAAGAAATGAGRALQGAGKVGAAIKIPGGEKLASAGSALTKVGHAAVKSQTPTFNRRAFPTFRGSSQSPRSPSSGGSV